MCKCSLLFSLVLGVLFLDSCTPKADVVFYNANVVDVEQGKVVPGMTVSVRDGIITKMAKSAAKIQEGEKDLTGLYLMPGLIDSHVHLDISMLGLDDFGQVIKCYLADGITTARDAGGDMSVMKRYEALLDSGKIVGPTFYYSSFWVGPKYRPRGKNMPYHQCITDSMTSDDLEKLVIEAKDFGCTGLKLYTGLSLQTLQKVVPLCHKYGIKPWGHAEIDPATTMEGIKVGVETVSHSMLLVGLKNTFDRTFKDRMFSPEEVAHRDSIYKEMIARGTILDATVAVSKENPVSFPVTREAYRAGVKIVTGTDLLSIYRDELRLLADSCGMTIPDVLRAATVNGAEVIGQEGRLGVIREGAEADLLVLTSNPLESLDALWQQQALYIDGKEVKY